MSFLGGILGVILAIPLAWFSAWNVTPHRMILFPFGRLCVISSRAIHETIWTILFVSILGFGMLAGVSALTMFCIGFAGKLFSDEIEAVDIGPVEAMRAAGANSFQVFIYTDASGTRCQDCNLHRGRRPCCHGRRFFGGGGMGLHSAQCTISNLRVGQSSYQSPWC